MLEDYGHEIHGNYDKFILGGRAYFAVLNLQSKHFFEYMVTEPEKPGANQLHFVKAGEQDKKKSKLKYVGCVWMANGKWCFRPLKDCKPIDEVALLGVVFVLEHSQALPQHVRVVHFGQCGVCGRRLTDPLSIDLGIGPTCRAKLGMY